MSEDIIAGPAAETLGRMKADVIPKDVRQGGGGGAESEQDRENPNLLTVFVKNNATPEPPPPKYGPWKWSAGVVSVMTLNSDEQSLDVAINRAKQAVADLQRTARPGWWDTSRAPWPLPVGWCAFVRLLRFDAAPGSGESYLAFEQKVCQDGRIPVTNDIRTQNEILHEKGFPNRFLPPNVSPSSAFSTPIRSPAMIYGVPDETEVIAGELGAPPIMRASITAPRGTMVSVAWSQPFIIKPPPPPDQPGMPGMPVGVVLIGQMAAVRVTNIDAVLNYLKATLGPRPGASARFLQVTPIVPGLASPMFFSGLVSEATFNHALQMLGLHWALPGGAVGVV